jgi:hypothetical protein
LKCFQVAMCLTRFSGKTSGTTPRNRMSNLTQSRKHVFLDYHALRLRLELF